VGIVPVIVCKTKVQGAFGVKGANWRERNKGDGDILIEKHRDEAVK
jgi:hypothetical protein